MDDERSTIFECKTGSRLYGTNRPESDEDYTGVFIPSPRDVMSLTNEPEELRLGQKLSTGDRNEAGDIDRKHWSIKRFLQLTAQGQSGPLEMLFAPKELITINSDVWEYYHPRIIQVGVSRKALKPFAGFALAQAHKATIKGENLNKIRALMQLLDGVEGKLHEFVSNAYTPDSKIADVPVETYVNDFGHKMLKVAGRSFDMNSRVLLFQRGLIALEARYGTRAEAAAQKGNDDKSLMHAYRMCFEAKRLLLTGKLVLPLPAEELQFLVKVRDGKCADMDHFGELHGRVDELNEFVEKSPLPEEPNMKIMNDICFEIMSEFFCSY